MSAVTILNRFLIAIFTIFAVSLSFSALAVEQIQVFTERKAVVVKNKILIEDFKNLLTKSPTTLDLNQMMHTVEMDLDKSGAFNVLLNNSLVPKLHVDYPEINSFSQFMFYDLEYVLTGALKKFENGLFEMDVYLHNAVEQKKTFSRKYVFAAKNWRKTSHVIADDVYYAVTGIYGNFQTKILFVSESGVLRSSNKNIKIVDYDGSSEHNLTTIPDIVLNPRYLASTSEVVFTSYRRGRPGIFFLNLKNGNVRDIASVFVSNKDLFTLPNFSPTFSQDGKLMAFCASENGNTDIYIANFTTGEISNIIHSEKIEASPALSPDGSKIAFVQETNHGLQKIFIYSIINETSTQITFDKGHYGSPSFSPDGSKIAFVHIKKGKFILEVSNADGSNASEIYSNYLVENPAWSPNGQEIIFSKKDRYNKPSELMIANLRSLEIRQFSISATAAVDPVWILY